MAVALAAPDWSYAGSRGGAQILTIERRDVEGTRVQGIEIGNTINPQDDTVIYFQSTSSKSTTWTPVFELPAPSGSDA